MSTSTTITQNACIADCIAIHRFRTQNSSDITIELLNCAHRTIDRVAAIDDIKSVTHDLLAAIEIERGIFEFALVHVATNKFYTDMVPNVYEDKLIDICRNLDENDVIGNATLVALIRSESFDPYFIAFLSPWQIHPSNWSKIIERRQERETAITEMPTSALHECEKCGNRKSTTQTIQLRSLDEPATIFITCVVCGYTFTI